MTERFVGVEQPRGQLGRLVDTVPRKMLDALASGSGCLWLEGMPDTLHAVLVGSALVPGEP